MIRIPKSNPCFPLEDRVICDLYEDGFGAKHIARLYCVSEKTIARRLKANGVEMRPQFDNLGLGRDHNCWKGGISLTGDGYLLVWVSEDDEMAPMRNNKGYIRAHRLAMARLLGRPLTALETVHHINGDKLDNNIENLQLRSGNHGEGQVRACGDCGSHNIIFEEI